MEAGIIHMYAGSTAPTGFLACDGSLVSRSTYADLFAAIGDTFGAGDGSTTFALPDLSGRVALGASQTRSVGTSGGEEGHVLQSAELPSHSHSVAAHGHANTITATTPALSHSITTQPSFTYNAPGGGVGCGSGSGGYRGTSSVNASLGTKVAIAKHAATACTITGGVTDCAAFDTESAGSGTAHNNMQPYITMMYIISIGE